MLKTKRILSILMLIMIIAGILTGCATKNEKTFQSLEDFKQARIGILTGSSHDGTAKELFPEAERVYFNTVSDMVLATEQGKIDGYIEDEPFLASVIWEGSNVKRLDESIKQVDNGFAFPQSEGSRELREQVNEFIAKSKADGTMDALIKEWLSGGEPSKQIDYTSLSGENGTIHLAVSVENKPAVYMKDNRYTGFEMDFLTRFAKEYGYKFEIEVVPFASLIAGIAAEKYDMASASLNITPEREESVDFSEPYTSFEVIMVVKGTGEQKNDMTLEDFDNATIGIMTGTVFDDFAKERFPNAKRAYFSLLPDMIVAVEQGKIDGYLSETTYYTAAIWEGAKIKALGEPINNTQAGFIFQKSEKSAKLREQMNSFVQKSKKEGTLDKLVEKWLGETEPDGKLDYSSLTGENGTLRIAVAPDLKPISYIKDGELTGYEMELMLLFAKEYGYKLDMSHMTFDAILPGVTTGKYDIGTGAFTITEERAESVDFSDSHLTVDVVMVVKNTGAQKNDMTLKDFDNANLGVVTGSIYDGHSKAIFPEAKIKYYQTFADLFQCVQQGKIDGFMADEPNFNSVKRVSSELSALKVPDLNVEIGYGFQKNDGGDKLKAEMDAFIAELKADGTIDNLLDKWYGDTEPTQTLEKPDFSDNKTTITVAVDTGRKPFVYMLNNEYAGFETEVMYMFCEKYGYNPVISGVPFASGLAGLSGGKFDLVAGGLYMTPERKESVNFSEPYMYADVVMVSYNKGESAISFIADFKESFEKTFIRENRWKLICEGIVVTMLISILSMLFGSILGFLLYLMNKSGNKFISFFAKVIGKVYSRIVAGTPIVVILMILFYLIFAEFKNLSGVVIAIVGFSLTFGAFVYDHMAVSVNSVDFGQTEAAYALGYSKNKTFFRIILPQAMTIFMPSFCGEVVSLIKATAVVGYIAVNDLTKMGDIIRSNTYEAFFPLIATAVIYFVLTWIVASLLNIVKRKFEPKRRTEKTILKGVER